MILKSLSKAWISQMKNNISYVLRFHNFFRERIGELKSHVSKLRKALPAEEYKQHELTKLLARLYDAIENVIPENPHNPDYMLKGSLAKFKRYKKGLQRHRLLFCSAKNPPIIVYLYVSDKDHLRKEGDKNDPYNEFLKLFKSSVFSHDPFDPNMQNRLSHEL